MLPIYADILLFLACFAAGYFGGTLKVWTLRRLAMDLDYRLSDVEGRVAREVKIRAGQSGQKARQADADLETWAKEQVDLPQAAVKPQVPPFADWWHAKMRGGK